MNELSRRVTWTVERYQEEHSTLEMNFLRLLKDGFENGWYDEEYFRWKYIESPNCGISSKIWFVQDGSTVVGFCGYLPVMVRLFGEICLATQKVDAVTHKDYRRKNMFWTMDQASLADIYREGCLMSYGTGVTEASTKGHLEKGSWKRWIQIEQYSKYIQFNKFPYSIVNLGTRLLHSFHSRLKDHSITVSESGLFEPELNSLYSRYAESFDFIVIRDEEHLSWRLRQPGMRYRVLSARQEGKIHACLVVNDNSQKRRYEIVDFAHDDRTACMDEVLKFLTGMALERNYCKITLSLNSNHPSSGFFTRNLFFSSGILGGYIINLNESAIDSSRKILDVGNVKIHFTRVDKNE